ncbi:hypothetical protein R1flu_000294 [Riccia fluitans]|uniref:F-box domain-containing protein n=1 Tax=Riccia fluitans TaxID=41844 RepID=A0ABD1Y498_9MARC
MDFASPAEVRQRTPSFSTPMGEEDLIPSLWQQLPVELLEKVLTKLPISALRNFSRVSKEWKSLIRSVQFARGCNSVEATFYFLDVLGKSAYMLLPNLKKNIWERHLLDFLHGDEVISTLVVADQGLLCYRISKKSRSDTSIILVVQNPLTRKFVRLIVPYKLELGLDPENPEMLRGLVVDKETGGYKVVVALYNELLWSKTFIYDSQSKTWSISAAIFPALVCHFDSARGDARGYVQSCVCSHGELFWVLEEWDFAPDSVRIYRWLIKYNFELDAWMLCTAVQQSFEGLLHQAPSVRIVHHDGENQPFIVNCPEAPTVTQSWLDLPSKVRFPAEFLKLAPNLGTFGIEDIERLVKEAGETVWPEAYYETIEVAFAGGTWLVVANFRSRTSRPITDRRSLEVFAVSINPLKVTVLPKVSDDQSIDSVGIFAATLKAFV